MDLGFEGQGCPVDGHGRGPLTTHSWRRAGGKTSLRYSHGAHMGQAALKSELIPAPATRGSPQVSLSVPGMLVTSPHWYLPRAHHWEVSAGAAQ